MEFHEGKIDLNYQKLTTPDSLMPVQRSQFCNLEI